MKKYTKFIERSLLILSLLFLVVVGFSYLSILLFTRDRLYSSVDEIPYNRVGVVLGTSKKLRTGTPNPFFEYRMDAAAKLYHAAKVDRLVISGDNGDIYYNEPLDMKKALIARGVKAEHLYMDAAGFRTLDSMVRMKEVFQETQFTVISQRFHNERAVFLAWAYDLDVIGFNAYDVKASQGLKVQMREVLARVKVYIDLLSNKQARFLGEPIQIN